MVLRSWALPRALNPAGGLTSTAGDLLTYGEFFLGDGRSEASQSVLSNRWLQEMLAPQSGASRGGDEDMSLGWQLSRIGTHRLIWHDGAAVGQDALLCRWSNVAAVPSRRLVPLPGHRQPCR